MEYFHIPVMLKEVMEYLMPKPGDNYIDCTLGGGGYTKAILERIGDRGKLLAIDLDQLAINHAKASFPNRNLILAHDNFKNLSAIVKKYFEDFQFDGIVFDLGLSSAQLEDHSRGFSFNSAGSPFFSLIARTASAAAKAALPEDGMAKRRSPLAIRTGRWTSSSGFSRP